MEYFTVVLISDDEYINAKLRVAIEAIGAQLVVRQNISAVEMSEIYPGLTLIATHLLPEFHADLFGDIFEEIPIYAVETEPIRTGFALPYLPRNFELKDLCDIVLAAAEARIGVLTRDPLPQSREPEGSKAAPGTIGPLSLVASG